MTDAQLRSVAALSLVLIALAGVLMLWSPDEDGHRAEETALVWEVDEDAATAITVDGPRGHLAFEKRDGVWWLTDPQEERAESWKVRDLLGKAGKAERARPITGEPVKFGLGEPPTGKIAMTIDGKPHTLVIGNAAPVRGHTYVRAADGSPAVVDVDLSGLLAVDPSDYRDHRVINFPTGDLLELTLASAAGAVRARRDGAAWWIDTFPGVAVDDAAKGFEGLTPAATLRGDPTKVEEAASFGLDLRYDAFADVAAAPVVAPRYLYLAKTIGGAAPFTIRVGEEDPKGARVDAGDGRGGWVYAEGVAPFGQGPTDLAESDAFVAMPDTALGVKVALGGTSWEIHRATAEQGWKRGEADAPTAAEALAVLSRAKFIYRPGPPPPLGAVWGTIEVTDGARSVVYEVGDLVGSERIVRDTRGGSPYPVSAAEVDAIRTFWGS